MIAIAYSGHGSRIFAGPPEFVRAAIAREQLAELEKAYAPVVAFLNEHRAELATFAELYTAYTAHRDGARMRVAYRHRQLARRRRKRHA